MFVFVCICIYMRIYFDKCVTFELDSNAVPSSPLSISVDTLIKQAAYICLLSNISDKEWIPVQCFSLSAIRNVSEALAIYILDVIKL